MMMMVAMTIMMVVVEMVMSMAMVMLVGRFMWLMVRAVEVVMWWVMVDMGAMLIGVEWVRE